MTVWKKRSKQKCFSGCRRWNQFIFQITLATYRKNKHTLSSYHHCGWYTVSNGTLAWPQIFTIESDSEYRNQKQSLNSNFFFFFFKKEILLLYMVILCVCVVLPHWHTMSACLSPDTEFPFCLECILATFAFTSGLSLTLHYGNQARSSESIIAHSPICIFCHLDSLQMGSWGQTEVSLLLFLVFIYHATKACLSLSTIRSTNYAVYLQMFVWKITVFLIITVFTAKSLSFCMWLVASASVRINRHLF